MKGLECQARASGLSSEGLGQPMVDFQVGWQVVVVAQLGRLQRSQSLPEGVALDVGSPAIPAPPAADKE